MAKHSLALGITLEQFFTQDLELYVLVQLAEDEEEKTQKVYADAVDWV